MEKLARENSTNDYEDFRALNSAYDDQEFWINPSNEELKGARDELDEHLRRRQINRDEHSER